MVRECLPRPRARGVPIIHVSTDYVFNGAKAAPYLENGRHGAAKRLWRLQASRRKVVAAANPRHVIVRTAWVHSPFGQNFVKTMLRLGSERPRLKIVADQLGNPTYRRISPQPFSISPSVFRGRDQSDTGLGAFLTPREREKRPGSGWQTPS